MGNISLREKAAIEELIREYYADTSFGADKRAYDEPLLNHHILERIAAIVNAEKCAAELMAPVYARDKYFFRTCPPPKGNLTEAQLEEVRRFWAPYSFAYRNNPETQRYFTLMSGKFDPSYLSFGLHYLYLRKFWNTIETPFITDKNDYDILFPDVKTPETIFHRINGSYYDASRKFLTDKEALEKCKEYLCEKGKDLILKPAREGEGRGIVFLRRTVPWNDNIAAFNDFPSSSDYICQVVIENHASWKYSQCTGLNVARINTMNFTGKPEITSSYLKTAVKDSGIVNMATGAWGILINDDGTLGERAVQTHECKWHYEFPNGEKFAGRKLYNYEKVKDTVLLMARRVAELKAIAWDVAVDSEGDVVLIELNACGGTEEYQVHGIHPYGCREKMKEILDEYLIKKFYYERADWEWDYWEFKNSITICKYAGLKKIVQVPEKLKGKRVTAIRRHAFEGKGLKKLIIPDSVVLLAKNALADCGKECEIHLPPGLQKK